jgi:exodeoxyribonuclease-3
MVRELSTWILRDETFRLIFDSVSVMSLYLPSGTNMRLDHKFMFMNDFQNYINDSKKDIQTLLFAAL